MSVALIIKSLLSLLIGAAIILMDVVQLMEALRIGKWLFLYK